jgi:hypothetical protein
MARKEPPRPPYFLIFEEERGFDPLLISVDDRGALPLFGSEAAANAFLSSTGFGAEMRPAEVSTAELLAALESLRSHVEYVALDPPPAGERGMRIEMGRLDELIEALEAGREDDLFGLGRN